MFIIVKTAASVLLLILLCTCIKLPAQKGGAPDVSIYLADPTVFQHDGVYYLYGTVGSNADNGFVAYTSADLKSWQLNKKAPDGFVLRKGDAYGSGGFWAPQVFRYQNKFYMAYVANENIAIAESDSPLGPFTQKSKTPLAAPVKQIDPFLFFDDNGRKYLYHVRLTGGNKIFVAELTDDLSAIKPETLKECITASGQWENTANTGWPVAEGPAVIKRDSLYYLFYTANDFRNPDYATGYATSTSPYGPWKKFGGNPIVSRKNIGINGTGHGDFVKQGTGWLYVFHTHYSDSIVGPRRTAIVPVRFVNGDGGEKVVVDEKGFFIPVINERKKSKVAN
jgi:xylan 1,4-beta-xylosidase